ncbi:MAG: ferrous iron transport protein A [Lachnospiraceae bacterium]|nr:ferrous iron transport protein A [Lachnospiraceae bacterium]
MKLSDFKPDLQGRVKSIAGDVHFAKRITSIGITEGSHFQMVRNDAKMPVLIYCRETLIAVNRDYAEIIEVEAV